MATPIPTVADALATGTSRPPVASTSTKSAGSSRLSNTRISRSSLAAAKHSPLGPAHVQLCLGYINPDKPFGVHHHHTSSRCLPSLAIRDFLPLQAFGLERCDGATTFAARRGIFPKGALVCRAMSSILLLHSLHIRVFISA